VLRPELTQDAGRTTALVIGSAWRWCAHTSLGPLDVDRRRADWQRAGEIKSDL